MLPLHFTQNWLAKKHQKQNIGKYPIKMIVLEWGQGWNPGSEGKEQGDEYSQKPLHVRVKFSKNK